MSAGDEAAGAKGVTELDSAQTFDLLQKDPNAVLIDVRTRAEWSYVGIPDLSSVGRNPVLIEWQTFPEMLVNDTFDEHLEAEIGTDRDRTLLFLCRSGARSLAAANAAHALGYRRCINVSDGFEGDLDQERRRGRLNGWKARGLPWIQT